MAVLHDPKIDLVRAPFLEGLSRFCFLLALGHFLCLAPLYLLWPYHQEASRLFIQYTRTLTLVGCTLTVLGILCRNKYSTKIIAPLCILILFLQPCYLLYELKSFEHPVVMLFPMLCFLVSPVLGRNSSFYVAGLSVLVLSLLNFFFFTDPLSAKHISSLILVSFGTLFSGYVSSILWKSVFNREKKLKSTLEELKSKSDQIDQWVEKLAKASALINEGSISLALPEPPPYHVFTELSHQVEEMQKKIGRHFGQMVLQDRINSLGVLASGVAHELNTPLTSLEFILETDSDKIPEKTRSELLTEVRRMGAITKEFLGFSSPQEQFESFDLNILVQSSLPMMKRLTQKQIPIHLDLSLQPVIVRGVRNQVEQILLNLFKNSADALSETQFPKFTVRTESLRDGNSLLCIKDNGPGISSNDISKIFDPFFTTKEPGKGVGLGLYLVREIVKNHAAHLDLKSDQQGTEFRIIFPAPIAGAFKEAA